MALTWRLQGSLRGQRSPWWLAVRDLARSHLGLVRDILPRRDLPLGLVRDILPRRDVLLGLVRDILPRQVFQRQLGWALLLQPSDLPSSVASVSPLLRRCTSFVSRDPLPRRPSLVRDLLPRLSALHGSTWGLLRWQPLALSSSPFQLQGGKALRFRFISRRTVSPSTGTRAVHWTRRHRCFLLWKRPGPGKMTWPTARMSWKSSWWQGTRWDLRRWLGRRLRSHVSATVFRKAPARSSWTASLLWWWRYWRTPREAPIWTGPGSSWPARSIPTAGRPRSGHILTNGSLLTLSGSAGTSASCRTRSRPTQRRIFLPPGSSRRRWRSTCQRSYRSGRWWAPCHGASRSRCLGAHWGRSRSLPAAGESSRTAVRGAEGSTSGSPSITTAAGMSRRRCQARARSWRRSGGRGTGTPGKLSSFSRLILPGSTGNSYRARRKARSSAWSGRGRPTVTHPGPSATGERATRLSGSLRRWPGCTGRRSRRAQTRPTLASPVDVTGPVGAGIMRCRPTSMTASASARPTTRSGSFGASSSWLRASRCVCPPPQDTSRPPARSASPSG